MPSPDQSIRVVNAARRLTDIATLSDEELTVLLRDIPVEDEKERQVLLAFHNIVKRRRDAQRTRPTPTAIPLLAARQLMYDAGVVPFGLVASNADDAGTETRDTIRAPYPKELWMDKPPKSAAGMGLTAWTTAVSPADGSDLEGLVVLPSRLGDRPRSPALPPTETRSSRRTTRRLRLRGSASSTGSSLRPRSSPTSSMGGSARRIAAMPFGSTG